MVLRKTLFGVCLLISSLLISGCFNGKSSIQAIVSKVDRIDSRNQVVIEIEINSKSTEEIVLYEDIKDYISVTSLDSEILFRPALRLSSRNSDETVIEITPHEPYKIRIFAEIQNKNGVKSLKLNSLGTILANSSGNVVFRFNIYPGTEFFDSNEGLSTGEVKIQL